jgi:hypothetical protein
VELKISIVNLSEKLNVSLRRLVNVRKLFILDYFMNKTSATRLTDVLRKILPCFHHLEELEIHEYYGMDLSGVVRQYLRDYLLHPMTTEFFSIHTRRMTAGVTRRASGMVKFVENAHT